MYLIVGLGNPGNRYINTRHNLGFRVIYYLAKTHNIKTTTFRFQAIIGKGIIAGKQVLLAQPQTYMNNSGAAVKLLVDYYKIQPEKVVIIYDDLDLPLGKIRVKERGSSGGNNGMKSIIARLKYDNIPRIRIGIGRPPEGMEVTDYILGKFSFEEEKQISISLPDILEVVEVVIKDGLQQAMNAFN